MKRPFSLLPCVAALCISAHAEQAADTARKGIVGSPGDVESATRKGLDLITRAGANWQKNKTCFSCHHQTLPMLAVVEAARAGFPADAAAMKAQADCAHDYFHERIRTMLAGEHVEGGAFTTGYGLWALSLAGRPADETTTAMVTYLLKIQGVARLNGREPLSEKARPWMTSCTRPPLQKSEVAATVLVLIGMEHYAAKEQRASLAAAKAGAEKWLAKAPLQSQEDRIWRLAGDG